MLIFFDIDATLITTSRSGMLAMGDAGRELFGDRFSLDGVEFAGRLDPLILEELLRVNERPATGENLAAMRRGYQTHLSRRLAVPGVGRALPGVLSLLESLRAWRDATLGLLTGNFSDTGQSKLRACGIDPAWFPIQVWGDESPHQPPRRDHLPPVGLSRYEALHGRAIHPSAAVIVGDTPHDVRCAAEHGLRSLAVATGSFSTEQLQGAGADRVVRDLSDTPAVLAWLRNGARGITDKLPGLTGREIAKNASGDSHEAHTPPPLR